MSVKIPFQYILIGKNECFVVEYPIRSDNQETLINSHVVSEILSLMYTSLKVLNISLISVPDNDFDVDGMRLIGRKALMNPPSSNASIKQNDF